MSRPAIPLAAWLYLAIAGLALVDGLAALPQARPVAAALIGLFLLIEVPRMAAAQRLVGGMLLGGALLSAAVSGAWSAVFIDGFARSGTFLLLFFSVAWLQRPAGDSPSFRAVRRAIVRQPPGRRFAMLSVSVHLIGSVLNLAGLALLSQMIERQKDPHLRKRLTVSLVQGFTSASAWSPFYISMVVILVLLPGLRWGEVAPWGMILSVAIVTSGWLFDRLARHRARGAPAPPGEAAAVTGAELGRTGAVLVLLAGLVIGFVEGADASIPVALAIVGPVFALLWYGVMAPGAGGRMAWLAHRVVADLPNLRGEAVVFVGATAFGVGLASALPSDGLGDFLDAVLPWTDARIPALVFTFLLCGMVGVHPVVVAIFLSAVLPPEALGLSELVVGLIFLATWGMSSMVSPISATNLLLGRIIGIPAHRIAWFWTWPSAFFAGVSVSALIVAIRHLTG